jgi:DNA modification methylase
VLTHRTVTSGNHPCEKPVPLICDLLKTVGADYQSVLDPFSGSGSTGVACVHEGRSFVGVDESAAYVSLTRRRIADAQAQPSLGVA